MCGVCPELVEAEDCSYSKAGLTIGMCEAEPALGENRTRAGRCTDDAGYAATRFEQTG